MAATATPNQPPSPHDLENFLGSVDNSMKNHCQEPGDDDAFASPETRQWRVGVSMGLEASDGPAPFSFSSLLESYETKLREDLKALVQGNICFAGLVTDVAYILATRLKRGSRGRVQDEDKTEKKHQLPNQLGSNLEFWLFYACI